MDSIKLNEEQLRACNAVAEGHNLFLTGPAGTGKSLTISKIIERAEASGKTVYVTASTGVAASLLGTAMGCPGVRTFHSWAAIGLGKYAPSAHAKFIMRNERARERIQGTDLLILDEVSMMDFDYMSKVNDVMQIVRRSNQIFGGIQVVFAGDFYQLPPTQKGRMEPYYLFESQLWADLIEKTVILKQVYRQSKQEFVNLLMNLRDSRIDQSVHDTMDMLGKNRLKVENGIKPTMLFCRNMNVDAVNMMELKRIDETLFTFKSEEKYKSEVEKKEHKDSFSFVDDLKLKVGAQVMCLINMDPELGIVNGSRGVVTHIHSKEHPQEYRDDEDVGVEEYVEVRFLTGYTHRFTREKQEATSQVGEVVASKTQYPFKLSWALTIHKSQGATIDLLDVDLAGCFAPGQAYVAISRGTSLDTLRVRNFSKRAVITSPKVVAFHDTIESMDRKRKRDDFDGPIEKKQKTKIQKSFEY